MTAERLTADREELARFIDIGFRYADEGGFVLMRSFEHETDRPILFRTVKLNGSGLGVLAAAAAAQATATALHQRPAVFAPPLCTFNNDKQAREQDVANGLLLSAELDAHPERGLAQARRLLGEPTMVISSGGEWPDPATGELQQKLHIHYRLAEPTRTAAEHAALKRARVALAGLTGGDTTNGPIPHPIRWAGSVHNKDPQRPRHARIIGGDPEHDIELGEAVEILEAAAKAAGIDPNRLKAKTAREPSDTSSADPRATREALLALAAVIPNDSASWDEWRAMSLRLFAASGGSDDGLDAFMAWSRKCADKHSDDATLAAWDHVSTYPPDRTGFAKLAAMAAEEVERLRGREKRDDTGKAREWRGADGSDWPEPLALVAGHIASQPYPIEALPPPMRVAVEVYQRFGQQPMALVASSALACASLACQGLADVGRDRSLTGPSSLNFLIVGMSGERKTACDRRFSRALWKWQSDRRKEMAPAIGIAKSRLDAWTSRRDGMLSQIKKLSTSTKTSDENDRDALERELEQHDANKPHVPVAPDLFSEDASPEALAVSLAKGHPSSSLWSDEGGLVIGSHAMSEDASLRFLAMLNRLWDARPFERKRTTRESVVVEGRRLTVSLMVQPVVAAKLVAVGDGIARGTGNLARFLFAWPSSTMGARAYREGDDQHPTLVAWDTRLADLLRLPLPIEDEETMVLQPPVLRLVPAAFDIWRQLHDDVERELRAQGEFRDLCDFGAKTAEQAARIACVLHVFEYGPMGDIGADAMQSGAVLALWHLSEARRALSLVGHSGELADAQALLDWLMEQPTPPTAGDVLRLGPYALRDKARRDKALTKLVEHGLAREQREGKATRLALNPSLRGQS